MEFQQSLLKPHLAVLLTRLVNKSILSATFPDCWKSAIVTPVPKSRIAWFFIGQILSNFSVTSFLQVIGESCV